MGSKQGVSPGENTAAAAYVGLRAGERVAVTCETRATIEETWEFTVPDGWESMSQEDREEALTWAAPDGDFIDDRIIGGEGDREWDLSSIARTETAK